MSDGGHGIHAEACNKKTSQCLSQNCLPALPSRSTPAVLVSNPVSLPTKVFLPSVLGNLLCLPWADRSRLLSQQDDTCHLRDDESAKPSLFQPRGGSTVRWVSAEDSTLTQPLRRFPAQAPWISGGKITFSQIWSFTQRCVRVAFIFDSAGHLFPLLSLHGVSSLCHPQIFWSCWTLSPPSLKQNHKNEWIYIVKSVSF